MRSFACRPGQCIASTCDELLDAGKLAISGPWADDTGALIIYDAEDMAEAERILDGDPYRSAGVIANATLKEWRVVLRAPWSNDGP